MHFLYIHVQKCIMLSSKCLNAEQRDEIKCEGKIGWRKMGWKWWGWMATVLSTKALDRIVSGQRKKLSFMLYHLGFNSIDDVLKMLKVAESLIAVSNFAAKFPLVDGNLKFLNSNWRQNLTGP